jgi:hypothetical protein
MKSREYRAGQATALVFLTKWEAVPSRLRIRALRRLLQVSGLRATKDEIQFLEGYLTYWDDDDDDKRERQKIIQKYRLRRGEIPK